MSAAQKRADIAKVRDLCDIILWQEIDNATSVQVLLDELPDAEWSHTHLNTECPISIRLSVATVVTTGRRELSTGALNITPHRVLNGTQVSLVLLPNVQPVAANTHWVSGAWTNPGQLGDDDGTRIKKWRQDVAGTASQLAIWVGRGKPVLFGGDLNTPAANMPDLIPGMTWAHSDQGYDKVAVFPAGASIVTGAATRVPLNSDHDLIVVPVTFA